MDMPFSVRGPEHRPGSKRADVLTCRETITPPLNVCIDGECACTNTGVHKVDIKYICTSSQDILTNCICSPELY